MPYPYTYPFTYEGTPHYILKLSDGTTGAIFDWHAQLGEG